jgi:small nuclear ribonucleoprotein (snRNP)-like protein
MNRKAAILSAVLAISLVLPTVVFAQQPASGDWSSVQALTPGEDLMIRLKDGKSIRGKLTSVTDSAVNITRKNRSETIAKDSIAEIYHSKRKAEKGKYALIGAGIGAGVGLGIGLAKNSPPVDDGELYPKVGAILGAGIGAVGGFLFGQGKRKRVLIFQAK